MVEDRPALPQPRRPAASSARNQILKRLAQQRGRVALLWLRGAPAHVMDFLGRVSSGRRHGDVTPDATRELRRNGRILLVGTKNLKRDVKNLQRTFSVFQR